MVNQVIKCVFHQDMHSRIDITPRSKKYVIVQGRRAFEHPWHCGTASERLQRPISFDLSCHNIQVPQNKETHESGIIQWFHS